MQYLIYTMFIGLFSLDYLHHDLKVTPRFTTWLPEVFALVLILAICFQIAVNKRSKISMGYMYLFLSFVTVMAAGVVINNLGYGPVIGGTRSYLRLAPFFLLPAVYNISPENFRKQLYLLLFLCCVQLPVAVYQRFIQFRFANTGDWVTGTLLVSGELSIVLLCAVAMVIAYMITGRVKKKFGIPAIACLFLPTTLNETKISLVILPIIVLVPAFFYRDNISRFLERARARSRPILAACVIALVLIPSFIILYNRISPPATSKAGILGLFLQEFQGKGYFFTGATRPGEYKTFGRGDAIRFAFERLSRDPMTLIFGLGMGNVMDTPVKELRGAFAKGMKSEVKGQNVTFTFIFWELGLSGFLVFLIFHGLVLRDALLLRHSNNIFGSFSLGWITIVISMIVCLVYANVLRTNSISVLFWYFSGIIASKAYMLRQELRNRRCWSIGFETSRQYLLTACKKPSSPDYCPDV